MVLKKSNGNGLSSTCVYTINKDKVPTVIMDIGDKCMRINVNEKY